MELFVAGWLVDWKEKWEWIGMSTAWESYEWIYTLHRVHAVSLPMSLSFSMCRTRSDMRLFQVCMVSWTCLRTLCTSIETCEACPTTCNSINE